MYKWSIFSCHISRNPEPSSRPTFDSISQQLCMSDTKLLQWTNEDLSVHPDAKQLGTAMASAKDLYKDLQDTYKHQ